MATTDLKSENVEEVAVMALNDDNDEVGQTSEDGPVNEVFDSSIIPESVDSSIPEIVEPPVIDASNQPEISASEELEDHPQESKGDQTDSLDSTETSSDSSEASSDSTMTENTGDSESSQSSENPTVSSSDSLENSSSIESSSSSDSSTTQESSSESSSGAPIDSTHESSNTLETQTSDSTTIEHPEQPVTQPPKVSQTDKVTTSITSGVFPSVGSRLNAQLAVQDFKDSDLNGFELPLLDSYQDKQEAAIVYAALSYLNVPYDEGGVGPESFNNLNFPRYLYQQLFSVDLAETFEGFVKVGAKVEVLNVRPGDLLVWEKEKQLAIYLGQNKFIMADNTLKQEQARLPEIIDETQEAIPGVRIFTLHLDATQENSDEEKDLLTRYDFLRTPDYSINRPANWELNEYGKEQLSQYPVTFSFKENAQTLAFIDSIGEYARDLGLAYDVFASVLIAQGILESGSGSSGLSRAPYYNIFGIKGSLGGASVTLPTMEDDGKGELFGIHAAFRVYPSYQESLDDYVALIRSGISGNNDFYRNAWRSEAKNYLRATRELTGKYATDTQYNNKLNSIIAAYNLTRFDQPRVQLSNEMMNFDQIPTVYREKIRFPEYNGQNYNTSGSYGSDQCTWYVYNRVTQLGGKVGDFMGNGADWRNTGDREGYLTSDVPRVGYVISFKQGVAGYHPLYGHVAFVEAVSDQGILISEGDASYINYRVIPNEIALSSGVGYLAPK